ncbi:hypothetical protein V5F32_11980 [Xanthobacter oligotrophicus]|uniref:PHB de-polymerase C-terminal domain-containing protein n=1 Tax=Xanthobacter oligotrophicus TaxID=2607286 RepID=A0ABW6ZVX0_9HYPH
MWLDDLRPLHFGAPAESERLNESAYQAFGIAGLGASVADVVGARLPFGQLRIFSRSPQPRRRVLVVAPMAGAYPFLMRDLVMALLDVADAVAVTEWPNARYVPVSAGRFGFAENCVETAQMARALAGDALTRDALAGNEGGIHVIGVCQGALPAFAAACLLAEAGTAPASLSLIGGPIDPSRNPTRLWRVLQERSLEALERQVIETVSSAFPGAGRRIFPAWRQIDAFALYLWRQSLSGGDLPFRLAFDDGDDPVRFPLARLCWSMMDVAGEFFMENVETVFRENALARDRLSVAGHEVRAEALSTTALLTVEGEVDDISARTQTEAAHDLCVNIPAHLKRQIVVPNAGHFALFYGRRMRETVLPALAEVMQAAEAVVRPAA